MIDPVLTPLVLAGAGWIAKALTSDVTVSVGTNLASSQLFDPLCARVRRTFGARMGGRDGSLVRNHDVEKAVRTAQMQANRAVVARFAGYAQKRNRQTDLIFSRRASEWIEAQFSLIDALTVSEVALARLIDAMDAPLTADDSLARAAADAADAALQELERGVGGAAPDTLRFRYLTDDGGEEGSWFHAFGAFLAEEIKENDRFYRMLTAARLAETGAGVRDIRSTLEMLQPVWSGIEQVTRQIQSDLAEVLQDVKSSLEILVEMKGASDAEKKKLGHEIDRLTRDGRVKDEAILGFLHDIGHTPTRPDQWSEQLALFANRYRQLLEQVRRPSSLPFDLEAARLEAERAVTAGRLDLAEERLIDLARLIGNWRREQRARLEEAAREEARALSRLAEVFRARFRHQQAATFFGQAAETLPESDAAEAWALRMEQARSLHEICTLFGGQEAARTCLELLEDVIVPMADARLGPRERTASRQMLGRVWDTRGRHAAGVDGLRRALDAYSEAREGHEQAGDAEGRVFTTNAIANVWMLIGSRTDDRGAFDRAAEAYLALIAMEAGAPQRLAPGTLKNNLGNVYRGLGDLENDAAMLENALSAYREARDEIGVRGGKHRRELVQNNIALTLWMIGERRRHPAPVLRAIDIHERLLLGHDEEARPLAWARTHHNLGLARLTLGEISQDISLVNGAIDNFQQALTYRNAQAVEVDWALSSLGLARAVFAAGRMTNDSEKAREAEQILTACQGIINVSAPFGARRMCAELRAAIPAAGDPSSLGPERA